MGFRCTLLTGVSDRIMDRYFDKKEYGGKGASRGILLICAVLLFFSFSMNALAKEKSNSAESTKNDGADGREILWVGDSRTEGLQMAMQNDDSYVCAVGKGYYWFTSAATQKEFTEKLPSAGGIVLVNLGINDLAYVKRYYTLINKIAETYPELHFYYYSVNPVNETKAKKIGATMTNEEIEKFNRIMKENLSERVTWIDTYSRMRQYGFKTLDGVHYTTSTYKLIYEYVMEALEDLEYEEIFLNEPECPGEDMVPPRQDYYQQDFIQEGLTGYEKSIY